MSGTSASSRAYVAYLERMQRQAECKHVFRPVPEITAYIQCPKCGKREPND